MDDLDDLLAGRDRFGHRLAGRLVLYRFDKITRHGQRNVSLQQGDAHFTQGGFDIFVAERALFGQAVKDTREPFAEIFKHGHRAFLVGCTCPYLRTRAKMHKCPSGRNALTGGDPDAMPGPEGNASGD